MVMTTEVILDFYLWFLSTMHRTRNLDSQSETQTSAQISGMFLGSKHTSKNSMKIYAFRFVIRILDPDRNPDQPQNLVD